MLAARNICAFFFIVSLGVGAFGEPLLFPVGLAALVGYFFSHLMILKKRSQSSRHKSAHKKPTCATGWGVFHILPLLCCWVALPFTLIYPGGGFSGYVDDLTNMGHAEYTQFNILGWIASMFCCVYAGAAGFALLLSLGWGRVHMIRSMQIQVALILISNVVDILYFIPKYNIRFWEPMQITVLSFGGVTILLALWCISNMRRSDVVAYFRHSSRNRKRNSRRGKSSKYDEDDPTDWWKRLYRGMGNVKDSDKKKKRHFIEKCMLGMGLIYLIIMIIRTILYYFFDGPLPFIRWIPGG